MNKIYILVVLLTVLIFNGCTAAPSVSPDAANDNPTAGEPLPGSDDPFGNGITDSFANSYFPLFAAIESEDIYLYGVNPQGMVLYQNDAGTYFDWPGLTPRLILPQMSYLDYDKDGKKDLAVILYVGSGTQHSQMDLHLLTIDNLDDYYKPTYTDHTLLAQNVNSWMTEELTLFSAEGDTVVVEFCGEKYFVKKPPNAGSLQGVGFGDIIGLSFDEEKIRVSITIGLFYEDWASASMAIFGEIFADVLFDGSQFKLSNHTINMDEY